MGLETRRSVIIWGIDILYIVFYIERKLGGHFLFIYIYNVDNMLKLQVVYFYLVSAFVVNKVAKQEFLHWNMVFLFSFIAFL